MNGNALDITTLESWLWEAACAIRGDVGAPKYKDYILPFTKMQFLCSKKLKRSRKQPMRNYGRYEKNKG